MQIKERLMTLKGDDGNFILTPRRYYDMYMKPNNGASFEHNKLVICPFHDDHDASMGTFRHKTLVGVELYHCFGCGATGDVITMHQQHERLKGNRMSDIEAVRSLAALYGIELEDADFVMNVDTYLQSRRRIMYEANRGYYNIRDYQRDIREISNNTEIDEITKRQTLKETMEIWKRKVKVGAKNDR